MSALGILLSYQLYQKEKKPVLALLLYQQIFLFSFLIYSIWGNATLRIILGDLDLNPALSSKLAFFLPMIGIPFMVVSWFMLLRFSFSLNGLSTGKLFPLLFFPAFLLLVLGIDVLIYKDVLKIPSDADLFVIRLLVSFNLLVHLVFLVVFLKTPKKNLPGNHEGFKLQQAVIYFFAILFSSAAISFSDVFGFISESISIVLVFGTSVLIPGFVSLRQKPAQSINSMDFEAFCTAYEISKREAEIITEICSGKSNKAIAEKLFITLQTVKDHNHRIFTKTGVRSRVQLANLVREKTEGSS